jgi:hypothetical protein
MSTVRNSIKTQRAGLVKLHDEIELASLDELIVHMETQFAAKATEPQWQKLSPRPKPPPPRHLPASPAPKQSAAPPAASPRASSPPSRPTPSGFAITSSTSSGSFDDVRRPSSFRSIIVFASVSRSCSFMPISAAAKKAVGDGEQPGLPIAMPAPIDGNGFQAEIDGGEMGAGGDAGLAQDRGGQQPAEPGRVLQDGKLVPGIEGDDRLQHRRQVLACRSTPRHSSSRASSSQSRS